MTSRKTKSTPRERLIEAAILQIETLGLGHLTIRSVAAAAGANVAAVNYHFRSKDALVEAALTATIEHMVADCEAYIEAASASAEEAEAGFAELLGYLLGGALRYPRISKAHLHDAFISDDLSGPFPQRFAPVMKRMARVLRDAVPGLDAEHAHQRVIAALSGVFFPAFFTGLFEPLRAMSRPARERYVLRLAQQACAPVG